jgi:hypothetical protein
MADVLDNEELQNFDPDLSNVGTGAATANVQPIASTTGTDLSTLANAGLDASKLFPGIQNLLSGGKLNASQSAYQNAINALNQAVPSQLSNLIPQLQLQVVQGKMTPAQAQAAIQQQSTMAGIQVDPSLMNAQTQALTQLQQIASSGGLTPTDKAQLMQINDQVNAQNQGRQLAVQDQARQQGIGGSGADLAARLSSAQAANTAASEAGTTVAANAQQRALQAIQQSGQLGGQIQQEQFGEAAQKAQAQDAINQFNTGLQQQTNLTNAQNQQQANLTNFNEANTVAGTNTGITNTQNLLPLQTAQEQNQQNLNWAGTAAKANQTQGAQLNTQAQQNTTANNSAVSGLIKNAPAIADAAENIFGAFSDERIKTDKKPLSDDDVDELMHKLTGYKYKYKKGSAADDGGKTHYGVMAQDLEKTPLKGSVVDTDKGKIVTDNDSKQNAILAVLAHLVDKSKGE